jgi:hypothetical protein
MPTPALTIDELVATLRRASLPTVIVEGTADASIYRKVEGLLGAWRGNVLPSGGRNNLLILFGRRNEFAHIPLAFLADRDTWLFTSIPETYSGVVWTHGYSIENDVYAGTNIENLMETEEKVLFGALLRKICEWFAFEIGDVNGRESRHAEGIGHVLNDARDDVRMEFLAARGCKPAEESLVAKITDNYTLLLRGKTLVALLAQILSHPKRRAKHSKQGIVECCLAMDRNPDYLARVVKALSEKLQPQPLLPIQ